MKTKPAIMLLVALALVAHVVAVRAQGTGLPTAKPESVGFLDPQSRTAMTKDAIFRIYSMSKAITSVAAMTLFEEGRFTLDEPVAKYLPQFEKVKVEADNRPGAPSNAEPL